MSKLHSGKNTSLVATRWTDILPCLRLEWRGGEKFLEWVTDWRNWGKGRRRGRDGKKPCCTHGKGGCRRGRDIHRCALHVCVRCKKVRGARKKTEIRRRDMMYLLPTSFSSFLSFSFSINLNTITTIQSNVLSLPPCFRVTFTIHFTSSFKYHFYRNYSLWRKLIQSHDCTPFPVPFALLVTISEQPFDSSFGLTFHSLLVCLLIGLVIRFHHSVTLFHY